MLDFPHIEVIRKKEERRKLPGHTCKECEIVSSALKSSVCLYIRAHACVYLSLKSLDLGFVFFHFLGCLRFQIIVLV